MNETPSRDALEQQLADLQSKVAALQDELRSTVHAEPWWPERFYLAYHVVVGALLGLAAAVVGLLFNVLGSLMVDQHPLQLIRVFLTFPLGERALALEDGFTLSAGCFLYLSTGMAFGALLHVVLSRFLGERPLRARLAAATALGLALWIVNFYGILSWLQPLLYGGRWILTEIPFWVAAATHLVFAWTLALISQFGRFEPPPRHP